LQTESDVIKNSANAEMHSETTPLAL